ncbi:MAG: hypothetical protein ABI587_15295 [Gemmatimonadales bacterium]
MSTDWNTAGNWAPVAVPITTTDVTIPAGTPNAPLTATGSVARDVTVQTGATVTVGAGQQLTIAGDLSLSGTAGCPANNCNLTVSGNVTTLAGSTLNPSVLNVAGSLTVAGTYAVSNNTLFSGPGQIIPASLPYSSLTVSGSATLSGRTTTTSTVSTIGAGILTLAGHTLVSGLVQIGQSTGETASLTMTNPLDSVITTNLTFQGGSTAGKLTAGVMLVSGNMNVTALNSPASFAPSGSHKVVLNGTVLRTVTMNALATSSHFQDLDVTAATGGVSFFGTPTIVGQLISLPTGAAPVLSSQPGVTLTAGGANITRLTLDTMPLILSGGTITAFSHVTFQRQSPTGTQLTVNNVGQLAPFAFDSLDFQTAPVAGGFYLVANDLDGATPAPLTIDMPQAAPATPGGFVQASNGAVINWPVGSPVKAWTGAISTDWSNPGNWNPAGVPGTINDLTIAPSTFEPLLTAASVANSITIAGLGAQLTIGGQTLTIAGNLVTHTDGLLVMTNTADQVIVAGDATFQGGDETGLLSAGELRVAGDFGQQVQTSPASFLASGTHRTVMTGTTSLQSVRFCCTAGASGFQNLDLSQSFGINIQFAGNGVFVFDTLISQVGAGTAPWLYMLGSPLTAARFRIDKLLVDRGNLILNEGGVAATEQFDNVTFQNYQTSQTQFSIVAPGGSPRTLTFNNLAFMPLVGGNTGKYLTVSAPSGTLVVDLPGATSVTNGPAFTTTSGAVTVNWPAAGKIWTGTTSTDWNVATNWSPSGVPNNADDVTIPSGTPFAPAVTVSCSAKSLTVNVGATLSLGAFNCQVGGNVFADGSITGAGAIQLATTAQLRGNIPALIASGAVTLAGRTVVPGGVTITAGSLTLAGHTLQTLSSLVTQGSGVLTMTNGLDSALVSSAGTFGGGDETGLLTAGYLKLGGSFGQTSGTSGASFAASGTHRTEMGAGAVRIINFATPGSGAATSHFNDLIVNGASGGINLAANTFINGQLISHPTGATPVLGIVSGPKVLTVGGVDISAIGIDQHVMTIGGGTITQFDNVAFTGQANAVTQLTINNPGAATPFTFTGVSFGVTPVSGLYLHATDIDGITPNALTINMATASPSAPSPSLFTASGGAVINWPAVAPAKTWTGAQTGDWNTTGNWSPAGIPTITDDVVIPLLATQPSLSGPGAARNLTVASGVVILVNGFTINVNGNLVSNASNPFSGGGVLQLSGTGGTISGALGVGIGLTVTGSYTLAGSTSAGSGIVSGSGSLVLGGQALTLAGAFTTSGTGTVTMTNALDQLTVAGNATFGGGSEQGLLTAGVLTVGGGLAQTTGGSAARFDASGTHQTVLTGASPTVNIQSPGNTPGTSHFQELTWAGGGTMGISALTYVMGQLTVNAAGTIDGGGFTQSIHVGNLVHAGLLTFFNAQLWIETTAPVPVALSNLTFTLSPTIVPLFIRHPGLPAGGKLTIDQATFTSVPTFPSVYLDVDDVNTGDGNLVVVDVTNASPAASTLFTVANGAVVNWPPAAGAITWLGTISSDWFQGSNWSGVKPPGVTDNVVIPAGTPFSPVVTTSGAVSNNLTIQPGATVDLGAFDLAVGGDLDNGGNITGVPASGILVLAGNTGQLLRGTVTAEMVIAGSYILNGRLSQAPGNVTVLSGSLELSGFTAEVGDLAVNAAVGGLRMLNPTDSMIVNGIASFDGTSTTGTLTAGVLTIGGDFAQGNTQSNESFQASGSHTTIFNGASTQSLGFLSPGPGANSRFQNLEIATTGGNSTALGSNVTVSGTVTASGAGALDISGHTLTISGTLTTAGGGTVIMQSSSDSVLVAGAAIFGGGDETGRLTDGLLSIGGSFAQNNSGGSNMSFLASGTHTTRVGAAAARVINFGTPSQFATGSHFANLDVTPGTGGITLVNGNNFANGQLISAPLGAAPTLTGGVLTVQQLNVSAVGTSLILDNVRITLIEQSLVSQKFDNVQFINFGTLNNQLDINAFGASASPRPLSFANLNFSPLSTGASAVYVRLTSINGPLGALNLSLPGSTQSPGAGGNGPTFSNPANQVRVGGALILWP